MNNIISKPQLRQDWIFDLLLKKPTITFLECFREYEVTFSKTEQTFSKDWKIAKGKQGDHLKAIQSKKLEVMTDLELKTAEDGILDKMATLRILSDIIKSDTEATGDKIRAVDVSNRMQGFYELDNEQNKAQQLIWVENKNYKTD